MGQATEGSGLVSLECQRVFSSSQTFLGRTKIHIECARDANSLEAKWLGCEADHHFSPNIEVKNERNYTPTPPFSFMLYK